MTVTDVIGAFFDGLLLLAFLIAVVCVAAAFQFGVWVAGVEYAQWRRRRHDARRPGYVTDITGSPWRHR